MHLRHDADWQQWTSSNRQLLEQWRALLTANPDVAQPTARETETARYAQLMELSDDILATFETGRGATYLSPNWERITGRPALRCLGSNFYACLHAESAKPFVTALQQAVCDEPGQMSLYPQQFLITRADGASRWFAMRIAEVRTLATGQQQITCGLRDVQDTLDAQNALAEARRETRTALQARSEFLGAMSHELRTPLNAILGFTQIMESGMYGDIANGQYREYLRHIRESGYELLAQIDEVMEMATVDSGSTILKRDVCDVADILQQVVALHYPQARALQLTLRSDVPPAFARLMADRTKLQHCVSHIVANALRFSRAGGRISLGAAFNDSRELCVTVSDDGMGMSARKLHALVSALQKEDSWANRNTNGLGLGLALAKEYARMHGGYLTLESKAGQGTQVSIHLPPECVVQKNDKVLQYAAYVL